MISAILRRKDYGRYGWNGRPRRRRAPRRAG